MIQSAYSERGWALQQAYPETEELRKYFIHEYGQPRETYVAGGSMGGALVMVTLEPEPETVSLGGLDLWWCGGADVQRRFQRRVCMARGV